MSFLIAIVVSYTGKSTKSDPFFYLRVFFGLFAPWSIPLIVALFVYLYKDTISKIKQLLKNPSLLLLTTGFFVVLFTLSIPKSKNTKLSTLFTSICLNYSSIHFYQGYPFNNYFQSILFHYSKVGIKLFFL